VRAYLSAAALFAWAAFSMACGYTLVGRGSFLPPNVKKISFPTFSNATNRVGLEQRLSRAVAQELASRGSFSVTSAEGQGDAELKGEILSFSLYPVSADAQGRATQYQIQIVVKVSLTTLPDGKVLWKNDAYTFRENYDAAGASIGAANYADLENQAIDAEAGRFAQSLVTSILEGF
jgi:outer membrane lipopolysaccharide assembly protein LptE/RlpB